MIFYYSGCGNSRWVAKELAQRLNQPLYYIPDEQKGTCLYRMKEGEPLGFVFPIYAWRPPQIVRQFVSRLKIEVEHGGADGDRRKTPYTFMVCTCGDNIGRADKLFGRLLKGAGLSLDIAVSITMPETYVNLPGFHLDNSQGEKQKLALARTNLPLIADMLRHGDTESHVTRGNLPWLNSSVVAWFFEKLLITDRRFKVEENCVNCGKCAEVCPVHNIVMDDGRPTWHGNCLNCMACYHYCPKNAIQFGRMTKNKGQYHYPDE